MEADRSRPTFNPACCGNAAKSIDQYESRRARRLRDAALDIAWPIRPLRSDNTPRPHPMLVARCDYGFNPLVSQWKCSLTFALGSCGSSSGPERANYRLAMKPAEGRLDPNNAALPGKSHQILGSRRLRPLRAATSFAAASTEQPELAPAARCSTWSTGRCRDRRNECATALDCLCAEPLSATLTFTMPCKLNPLAIPDVKSRIGLSCIGQQLGHNQPASAALSFKPQIIRRKQDRIASPPA